MFFLDAEFIVNYDFATKLDLCSLMASTSYGLLKVRSQNGQKGMNIPFPEAPLLKQFNEASLPRTKQQERINNTLGHGGQARPPYPVSQCLLPWIWAVYIINQTCVTLFRPITKSTPPIQLDWATCAETQKINVSRDQEDYNGFKYTDEKLSTRRIHWWR